MINLPKRVIIQEVVLRDGLQNEKQIVSTDEKLKLVDRLIACGLRQIEITSFVNPHLVPQMADAEDLCNRLKQREGITFSALILSEKGLDRAMRCGMSHVGVYVSASETHSRRNSNRSVRGSARRGSTPDPQGPTRGNERAGRGYERLRMRVRGKGARR